MTVLERLSLALSDRYALERELGRGGMATVFLATDRKHDRKVALKVLHPELAASVGHERFLREIRIVAGLTHPRILTLIDSGEADGLLYFVMPYVEGETLKDRLDREGPLGVDEALRIGREVADALAYAHEQGVIHRDIKPSNILFEAGHAVIADFGVARAVDVAGESEGTATGLAVGTPKYMSPEQASGGDVDGRADVYALGCVLWEMLAGDAPFDGPTPQAILARKLSDETPSVRTRRRTVPPEVEGVVVKAMAPLAADRYATARELERALEAPEGAVTVRRPRSRPRPRGRAIAGVAIAGIAAVAGWWLFGRGTPAEAAAPYALAVLAPENLTAEEEHFVAGQHQALIDRIAAIHGFRVISRRSVLGFQDTGLTVPEIAAELGVRGIVTSSLERHGDSLRIRVELVQGQPEEALLWSGSFEGTISGLYGMYGEAARAVADGAEVELSPVEITRLGGERYVDPVTYEAYLQGMHLVQKGTPEAVAEGLAHLHDATDRSPTDALAWAGLAIGYSAVGHGPFPTDDVWTMARAAAERAVRLDSTLAEGWSALGDVRFYADWDWAGAEEAFRRANELNPSIPMNHFHYAWLLLVLDRYDEAIAQHELAKKLDPFTPFQSALLGWAYLYGGDTERAKEQAGRTLELNPDGAWGLFVLGSALQIEGNHGEAIATHERMAELYPYLRWLLGATYARAGRTDDALRVAREIEEAGPSSLDAYGLAVLYGALGDVEATHRWATREPHHAWLPALPIDPIVGVPREVLADPRFEDFMARMNLPWWEG